MKRFISIFLAAVILFSCPVQSQAQSGGIYTDPGAVLEAGERDYLLSVYKDTWNYLATFVSEESGLPYDSEKKQPATSISNVGLYLAAIAVAFRTELISREEAVNRIERALISLE